MKTIIICDTETTGLGHIDRPPRKDGVIQVGYAWRKPDGEVQRWHTNCNPGEEFFERGRADIALRINKIGREEVAVAPPVHEAAAIFRGHLKTIAQSTGRPVELRAYNRAFDLPFLRIDPWSLQDDLWGPCVMLGAARHLDGPFGRWPKLVDACRRMDIPWPEGEAHNAAVDSHAALLVHEAMLAAKGEYQ